MVKISFKHKGKKVELDAKECKGINRGIGLMFKPRGTKALVFSFKKPTGMAIHSLFVFFSFIAVWLDENGKVIEIRKVKPFTFSVRPEKSYKKLIEIPLNNKYVRKIELLVGD
jgi:uncharacterized membrane protein (UPF0127 family)